MALPRNIPPFENVRISDKPLPKEFVKDLKASFNNTFDLRDYLLNLFVDDETPSGQQDGSNTVFSLKYVPMPANSLRLYRNGKLLTFGTDFILNGATITYASGSQPTNTDIVLAYYRKIQTAQGTAATAATTASQPSGPVVPPVIAAGIGLTQIYLTAGFALRF